MLEALGDDDSLRVILAVIAVVIAAISLSWTLIWALQPIAHRVGLLDHPRGDRKNHAKATPVTGGLGMILGITAVFLITPTPMTATKWAFLLGSGLLVIVGLLDDILDLRWWWRILVQAVAALIMVYVGDVRVEQLGRVFGLDDLTLGVLSVPFTIFATVGLINAINMIDGADGVAGTLVAAAFLMLSAAAWYAGNVGLVVISATLFAAVLGFLAHNAPVPWRPRARVFMGNAGSAFLGYAIAWLSFRLTQNQAHPVSPVLALWLVAIPVMDCLVLIARRLREKHSPFHADRNHIHHILRDAGFSSSGLVLTLGVFALAFGLAIAQAMRLNVPDPLLLCLFLGLCISWYLVSANRENAVALVRKLRRRPGTDTSDIQTRMPPVPTDKTELAGSAGRASATAIASKVAATKANTF